MEDEHRARAMGHPPTGAVQTCTFVAFGSSVAFRAAQKLSQSAAMAVQGSLHWDDSGSGMVFGVAEVNIRNIRDKVVIVTKVQTILTRQQGRTKKILPLEILVGEETLGNSSGKGHREGPGSLDVVLARPWRLLPGACQKLTLFTGDGRGFAC